MTVAEGMEAACNQFVDRTAATGAAMEGDCGIGADVGKHGVMFAQATLLGLMLGGQLPAGFTADVPGNDMLGNVGVNGDMCPNCDFAARAYSDVDNDVGADVWWVSSQILDTPSIAGCPPGMTLALMNAFTSGSPAPVVDDVCYDGQ
jgi:hypothetical protein